jgi:hypothetical protein
MAFESFRCPFPRLSTSANSRLSRAHEGQPRSRDGVVRLDAALGDMTLDKFQLSLVIEALMTGPSAHGGDVLRSAVMEGLNTRHSGAPDG